MKEISKILKIKYLKSTILGLSTSVLLSIPAFSESFSEAFSKARSQGLAEFMYNGKMYNTQTKEEKNSLNYGPFPVTLKNYNGKKTNSVAYTGQIARHVLHDSLKKVSSRGDGNSNPLLYLDMSSYFYGSDDNLKIIAPASKDGFPVKQTMLNDISRYFFERSYF